jgi:hypothetical protein
MSLAIAGQSSFRAVDPRQLGSLFIAAAVLMLLLSVFAEDSIAYLCVTIPVLIPLFLWVSYGAFGIPVLPLIAMLFYLYYAMPLLMGDTLRVYKASELVWATLSVGYFLLAASIAAWPFLAPARKKRPMPAASTGRASRYVRSVKEGSLRNIGFVDDLNRLIFVGLALGVVFNCAGAAGELGFLGTFAGVIRACVFPLIYVACYLTGFARGAGLLTGQRWLFAFGGFAAVTVLSISSLFLVGGAMNIAALVLGYVLGTKRLPWGGLIATFALLSILNAGKGAMREMYWAHDSQSVQNASLSQVPVMLGEWFVEGVRNIGSTAARAHNPSLLERTSLLHMVLAVQEATPKIIPFLNGETYAMLPQMLVPRFLQPDKIESQAVLNLLSVRYGRESGENTSTTTIGWGMVAEAYANFGNLGVVAVGAIFGLLCGFLMRLSATAGATSVAMLIAIASTLTLCNVESDFSYTMVTLFQTVAGVCIFAALPRLRSRRGATAALAPVKPRAGQFRSPLGR